MSTPTDRVVVLTGASSGIGLATARAFAGQGAHLVLAARGTDRLEEAADPAGAGAGPRCCSRPGRDRRAYRRRGG